VSGTVTSDGSTALPGVTVTVLPESPTTTTNSQGAFTFSNIPLGAYQLSFHLSGYEDQTLLVTVNLAGPTHVQVTLTANPDAGPPPTVVVSDQLSVGFNAPVSITATATGSGLTYAWKELSGPALALTGANTPTLSFVTPAFVTSLGYSYPDGITDGGIVLSNARCGVRGIDRDQANHSVFQIVVTDSSGRSATGTVEVDSTRPTTGVRDVPLGIPVWLEGNGPDFFLDGGTQTTWSWTITAAPNGSNASLYAADGLTQTYAGTFGQYAYFVPDVAGVYTLTETISNAGGSPCSLQVYAGTWLGVMTITGPTDSPQVPVSPTITAINCLQCHNNVTAPDKFTPWAKTAHATALQRKLEGSAGQAFNATCLECHTLGYDKTAVNNGFDDVAAAAGWNFPASNQPGNWSMLESIQSPNDLADLAGIQCESCHGPQGNVSNVVHSTAATDSAARISWSEEVCASCHEDFAEAYKPSQWVQQGQYGGHSNRALAVNEGGNGSNHCARCHSAQGYARYSQNLPEGYYGYLTSDGKPLDPTFPAAGATNTPASAAQLSSWGMNKASVEPQTCAACHDPHSAANPHQLRIYDSIPALPNGLTGVSGLGAGAVCVTCHNSRNGEHTDFSTQITQSVNAGTPAAPVWTSTGVMVQGPLATFTTPHTASQADVYFGFNAYFGTQSTPSAHLAVADSCVGCHNKVPTASESARGETTNHSFVVDNTICTSCHSANVDGVALQAANRSQLDTLRNLWASRLLTNLNAAINTAGVKVTARAYDPVTGFYTSATKSQYIPITQVTAITWANIGTVTGTPSYGGFGATAGLTLTLATPVTNVTFYDASNNPHVVASIQNLTVTLSSVTTNQAIPAVPGYPAATYTPWTGAVDWTTNGPVAYLPPWVNGDIQTLIKAYWNMTLLSYDDTFGIHNPSFFNDVIANTSERLETVQ
jgi:predicted CXXCH cytochrome family protein